MILVCDVDNVNVFFFDKRQSDKKKKEHCVSFIDCVSVKLKSPTRSSVANVYFSESRLL